MDDEYITQESPPRVDESFMSMVNATPSRGRSQTYTSPPSAVKQAQHALRLERDNKHRLEADMDELEAKNYQHEIIIAQLQAEKLALVEKVNRLQQLQVDVEADLSAHALIKVENVKNVLKIKELQDNMVIKNEISASLRRQCEEFEAELATLRQANTSADISDQQIHKLRAENKELSEKCAAAVAKITVYDAKLSESDRSRKELAASVHAIESKCVEKDDELRQSERQCQILEANIAESQRATDEAQRNAHSYRLQSEKLQDQLDSVKTRLVDNESNLNELLLKTASSLPRAHMAEVQIKQLTKENEEMRNKLDRLEVEHGKSADVLGQKQQELDGLKALTVELTTEIGGLKDARSQADFQTIEQKNIIDSLQRRLDAAVVVEAAAEEEMDKIRAVLEDVKNNSAKVQDERDKAVLEASMHERTCQDLEKELKTRSEKFKAVEENVISFRRQVQQLELDKEMLTNAKQDLEALLTKNEKEAATMREKFLSEAAAMKQSLAGVGNEKASMQVKIDHAGRKILSLESHVADLELRFTANVDESKLQAEQAVEQRQQLQKLLTEQKTESESTISTLKIQLVDDTTTLRDEISQLKYTHDTCEQQCKFFEAKLLSTTEELQQLTASDALLQAECKTIAEKHHTSQRQCDALRCKAEQLQLRLNDSSAAEQLVLTLTAERDACQNKLDAHCREAEAVRAQFERDMLVAVNAKEILEIKLQEYEKQYEERKEQFGKLEAEIVTLNAALAETNRSVSRKHEALQQKLITAEKKLADLHAASIPTEAVVIQNMEDLKRFTETLGALIETLVAPVCESAKLNKSSNNNASMVAADASVVRKQSAAQLQKIARDALGAFENAVKAAVISRAGETLQNSWRQFGMETAAQLDKRCASEIKILYDNLKSFDVAARQLQDRHATLAGECERLRDENVKRVQEAELWRDKLSNNHQVNHGKILHLEALNIELKAEVQKKQHTIECMEETYDRMMSSSDTTGRAEQRKPMIRASTRNNNNRAAIGRSDGATRPGSASGSTSVRSSVGSVKSSEQHMRANRVPVAMMDEDDVLQSTDLRRHRASSLARHAGRDNALRRGGAGRVDFRSSVAVPKKVGASKRGFDNLCGPPVDTEVSDLHAKERSKTIALRNERMLPHMRSSYAVEPNILPELVDLTSNAGAAPSVLVKRRSPRAARFAVDAGATLQSYGTSRNDQADSRSSHQAANDGRRALAFTVAAENDDKNPQQNAVRSRKAPLAASENFSSPPRATRSAAARQSASSSLRKSIRKFHNKLRQSPAIALPAAGRLLRSHFACSSTSNNNIGLNSNETSSTTSGDTNHEQQQQRAGRASSHPKSTAFTVEVSPSKKRKA